MHVLEPSCLSLCVIGPIWPLLRVPESWAKKELLFRSTPQRQISASRPVAWFPRPKASCPMLCAHSVKRCLVPSACRLVRTHSRIQTILRQRVSVGSLHTTAPCNQDSSLTPESQPLFRWHFFSSFVIFSVFVWLPPTRCLKPILDFLTGLKTRPLLYPYISCRYLNLEI